MINNTTLVGRLTKAPELKKTGNGISVMGFTLAVERNFTNAQGERETDFINCVAWRGTAETLAKFAARGSLIGVTGSMQTRNYQNTEGQTVYITEVLVDNFQMLEPKAVTDNRRAEETNNQYTDNNKNFYDKRNYGQQGNENDDLPF